MIVITDRQVLDRHMQDAIYQIEHAQGVVKAIDQDSKQLADALMDGTKIVVTTLQKFPFVLRGLLRAAGAENVDAPTKEERAQAGAWEAEIAKRRYAVIADEAHSGQSGETAKELKAILGAGAAPENGDEEPDWEDNFNRVMQSRGPQPNISFFAFTATPKGKTLELFGRIGNSGKPEAFHLYSMRQAIEERYILDVVKNYTTYKTYFKLVKKIEDDPDLPKKKAARALAKFLVLHPTNIEQKIEVIVEHFRRHVKHHLDGRAKAMVVTASRLQAVKYFDAFKPYYDATSLQEVSDPSQLDKLKFELDSLQVYHWSEVEAFAHVFYRPPAKQTAADHARIHNHLQPAVDRFKALASDELRDDFRDKLAGYVRVYSFLSQIMPYADPDLEMLYSYGRSLLPNLPSSTEQNSVNLGDDVSLHYYRLQRVFSGAIELHEDVDEYGVKSPTDVGSRKAKDEKAPLSEIIELLNERFGTNFTEADRLFFEQIKEKTTSNPKWSNCVRQTHSINSSWDYESCSRI